MPVIDTETAEGKAALQKLIDAETEGLKSKNTELINAQKKLKDDMKGIQAQLDEIAAAKEAAEQEAVSKSGDIDKVKSALEAKHKKELETLTAKLSTSEARLNQTLIDKGLAEGLVKANVAPQYLPAVTALIKSTSKAEIVDQDGNAVAMLDGKPLTEFIATWAQGDQGKHYIAAPNNGGGGSNGSNGNGQAATVKTMTRSAFEKLPPAEQRDFSVAGGKLTE